MRQPQDRPVITISLGDPGGIGPEVTLKAWADDDLRAAARWVLVGSVSVLRVHAEALGRALPPIETVTQVPSAFRDGRLHVLDVADEPQPEVAFGEVSTAGGRLSMQAVARAVDLCREGAADAMVTAPISKAAIARAGYDVPGHTEFIAGRVARPAHPGEDEPLMLMVGEPALGAGGALRVGLVSVHEPLKEVAASVTADAVRRKLRILAASLRRDFAAAAPHIAVLGLNPHAGDGGALGREEETILTPAIEAARQDEALEGVTVEGPLPADGFFGTQGWARCDAVLACYHDQGLGPFKALTFGGGVNMTAGLPIVRTSPDHGTAFDIAGQGQADPGSMKSALRLAAEVARRRALNPEAPPAS